MAFTETTVRQSIMTARPKIECEIHDLLGQANVMLLSPSVDVGPAAGLIGRLRNCADQARDKGLDETAERMHEVANQLEQRLLSEP